MKDAPVASGTAFRPYALTPESPRYQDACAFIPPKVAGLVRNASVKPHWIGGRDCFWYRRETPEGGMFLLVDAEAATVILAFDHEHVAAALGQAAGKTIDSSDLPIETVEFSPDLATMVITTALTTLRLDRRDGAVTAVSRVDEVTGQLISPDGKSAAFCRDHNIWLRDLASGSERPLTMDGAKYCNYGTMPDAGPAALFAQRNPMVWKPFGIVWSPDSYWLAVSRVDERHVASYPFMIWAPRGKVRPEVAELRHPLIGDRPQLARRDHFAIEAATGFTQRMQVPDGLDVVFGTCWWDDTNATLYTTAQDLEYRRATLLAIELRSGAVRVIVDERAKTHHDYNLDIYRVPNVQVLNGGKEAIWFSERDGWGHLYLYDGPTGRLIRQLTQGPWVVFDLIHVDAARRQIYVAAGGREAGHNPYYRHLYRVPLDGGEPILLTPEEADHAFRSAPRALEAYLFFPSLPPPLVSPSGRFFVDTFSTVTEPPMTLLRRAEDGGTVMTLETADISALRALGQPPPVPFVEKAADGVTDIYGQIYFPPGADPARRYAVIDAMVGAPYQPAVQHQFVAAMWDWNPPGAMALSRLGFIVVQIDGRGSIYRDKAFHDFAYGRYAENGLIDHVAVLKRLGQRYPSMDLDRAGVYGYSQAAYFATRALLDYPDFYKAGVALGGSFHFDGQLPFFIRKWLRTGAADEIRALDCRRLAAKLDGAFLMVTGDADEIAPAALTLQMADALIAAGKDFELLIMTNHGHLTLSTDPYVLRRMWSFFLRHLG